MTRKVDAVRLLKGLYRHFQHKAQDSQKKLRSGADSAVELGFERGMRYAAATIRDIHDRLSKDDIEAEDEEIECQLM